MSPARPVRPVRPQLPPLEPRQARGILGGLAAFALGFAVAGVLVAARQGGTPTYLVAITVGFVGIGVVGLFSRRVPTEVAPPAMWSPRGLDRCAGALGLPTTAVMVVLYGLLAVSVVGNLLIPLVAGRR